MVEFQALNGDERKIQQVMSTVRKWGAYWRENPQRFAKEYLNLDLDTFQKINLYEMFHSTNFMYWASRGQGKQCHFCPV